jgi:hypothetical protein
MNPALETVTRTEPVAAFDGEATADSKTAAATTTAQYFIAR